MMPANKRQVMPTDCSYRENPFKYMDIDDDSDTNLEDGEDAQARRNAGRRVTGRSSTFTMGEVCCAVALFTAILTFLYFLKVFTDQLRDSVKAEQELANELWENATERNITYYGNAL